MVYLALLVAVSAVSAAAPLIHAAKPAPALTVAALRISLAAILLMLASGKSLASIRQFSRRQLCLAVSAGVFLAAHFGTWVTSLYLTSTAASVALVATQPIFAAILGIAFLGEGVRRREALGIAVAAVGCLLLARGDAGNAGALAGDMLAVFGALTAAAYFVVGRGLRETIPLLPYLALVNVVAGCVLMAAVAVTGSQVVGFTGGVYLAIVAAAVLPSIVGHTLLNWSVRKAPAHLVALAILGEPIGASFLAWFFQNEDPPVAAVLGGGVILVGIGVGFVRRRS